MSQEGHEINVKVDGNFRNNTDNYTYVMHLKLDNGVVGPGSHTQSCEQKVAKAIFNKKAAYKVGDKMKITITQMNDRGGSFSYLISNK